MFQNLILVLAELVIFKAAQKTGLSFKRYDKTEIY